MKKPYSLERKKELVGQYLSLQNRGRTKLEACKELGVSYYAVEKWTAQLSSPVPSARIEDAEMSIFQTHLQAIQTETRNRLIDEIIKMLQDMKKS